METPLAWTALIASGAEEDDPWLSEELPAEATAEELAPSAGPAELELFASPEDAGVPLLEEAAGSALEDYGVVVATGLSLSPKTSITFSA